MKTLLSGYINVRDLLGYDKVVLTKAALEHIEAWLGKDAQASSDSDGSRDGGVIMNLYEVLIRPVITEKTMIGTDENNTVTFEVDMRANKHLVKDAVEKAFDVDVVGVNIMVMPAKTTRRGSQIRIRKPKWKKAIVALKPGDRIQLFEGV